MSEENSALQNAINIKQYVEKARGRGEQNAILNALDAISRGAAPDEALGLRTPNGERSLASKILTDRKMYAFQALIAALQDEGKTRAQALDEIYLGVEEGEKGHFGWTRESAESAASKGNHLRNNPYRWRA